MRLYIIKNKTIRSILLPEKIDGNYWISDYDKNGAKKNIINIESSNNNWKLLSNKNYICYSPTNKQNENYLFQYLYEYDFYYVKNKENTEVYEIYCAPIKENLNHIIDLYSDKSRKYIIGSGTKCNIQYKLLNELHAWLVIENNILTLCTNDSRVFLNNEYLENNKQYHLCTGDIIFMEGLKIVPKINASSIRIYINNPGQLISTNLLVIPLNTTKQEFEKNLEDEEINLYNEEDYFHKSPRFVYSLTPLNMEIEAPPQKQQQSQSPFLLTAGPIITMSLSSVLTCYLAVNNIISGKTTWQNSLPTLITSGAMMLSVFVWPLIRRIYQKSVSKKAEKFRQEKYKAYIDKIIMQINEGIQNQQRILKNKFPTIDECEQIINNKMLMLWQRNPDDEDFMSVSLGYGNIPMFSDIKYPAVHFTLFEDELMNYVDKLRMAPKLLTNVPVPFSFLQNNVLGIVGQDKEIHSYLNQIILQLVTHHSYTDLKLVLFTEECQKSNWDFMRILPHSWNNDKTLRFFANNTTEYNEICYALENLLSQRINNVDQSGNKNIYSENYLIIVDNYKLIRSFDLINKILKAKINYGFNLIILNDKISTLPDQCKVFIKLDNNKAELIRNISNEKPYVFYIDNKTEINIYDYAQKLANIPVEINDNKETNLPEKVGFLEMYDVGKVESLNCKERWKNNNPILTLQAPVGYDKNGELLNIDLHEKYHGPHGIIAGMTGSGKSEFIITYILSLAINYHPYEVQFILIDYKGGGIAGAFENNNLGIKLPHLVGTITNLDVNEIERSFASIESELRRRQRLFNYAREVSSESTVDIYKYQRMYREGILKEPISHLFIISDEFAELKSQQPEFMQQLISIARIGRSLGVHLILATQKPSGIVDAQIWSNTRFRVCLRVQEKEDSKEVIQCPDAAFLKQTGRFYFQVGYNEVFKLGQAAYAGGKYFPSDITRKEIDTNINYINNVGYIVKSIPTKKIEKNIKSEGEELGNIVKYIINIANKENLKFSQLWKDKIPNYININDIIAKYNYKPNSYEINIPVGEYDAPHEQEQYMLIIPFSKEGNVLLYGAAGSGKENFITTLIYSSMLLYNANQLNYYLLDFGSQSLNVFKDSPLVGDVMNIDSVEKINKLISLLKSTIEVRKQLFTEYNGNFNDYIIKSGKQIPNIIIIINNYEIFQESFSALEEQIMMITRDCIKYGIYFLLACSTPNGVKFKLKQNFTQIYSLQQNSIDDYMTILGNTRKKYPSKIFGRGIFNKGLTYEFQTAYVDEKEKITITVKELCKSLNDSSTKANYVPVLPKKVNLSVLKGELGRNKNLILGIEKESLQYYKYYLKKDYSTIITGDNDELLFNFTNSLIEESSYLNINTCVVNSEGIEIPDRKNINIINDNFDEFFEQIYSILNNNYQKYIKSNKDKSIFAGVKPFLCIIYGVKFLANPKMEFIFEKGNELGIINFIIVDTVNNMRMINAEKWYKNNFENRKTIWVGPGINEQFVIKINTRLRGDITEDFALIINRGKYEIIKYLNEF